MISASYAIWAIICMIVGLSFWLEKTTLIGKSIGAKLLCVLFGMTLENTPLLPITSPVYDTIFSTITYLFIVWLLLSVHLSSIFNVGPKLLVMFIVACLCTALGSSIAFFFMGSLIPEYSWKLSRNWHRLLIKTFYKVT